MDGNRCRLCSKNDNTAVSVFDQVEKNLSEKIKLCFGVQIEPDDPITKKICRCCYYFTNSAFEHRVASQENDIKLRKEYEESVAIKVELKSELTQNDFLNNLKLTNKDDVKISNNPHPSVEKLKRKYPNINIPECCNTLDLDPYVDVLRSPAKKRQKINDTTWSIANKKPSSAALGLTIIKTDIKEESDNDSEIIKKTPRRRLSSTSSNSSNISVAKLTRSTSKAFGGSPIKDVRPFAETDDMVKGFTCRKCDKSYVRFFNLQRHKCRARKTQDKSNSPTKSQSAKTKLDTSPENTETFKSPKNINIITSPLSKIANTPQLKSPNTDLKTLLEINEKINDSISKLSKVAPAQEIPKNIEQNPTTSIKENLSNVTTVEVSVDKETVDKQTENQKNDQFNTSDLLVEGEEVNAFLCLTCNKVFDTLDCLKYHKRYAHKLSLRCDKCPKKFTVVETLMKHKKIHDDFKRRREAHAQAKAIMAKEAAKMSTNNSEEMKNSEESNDSTIATSNDDTSCDETVDVEVVDVNPEIPPEKEEPKNGVKHTGSLPQLAVTLEPLEYAQNNKDSPQLTRGRMVARKRTDGALFNTNATDESQDISSDSDSSLSSSDEDDCRITEVFMENNETKEPETKLAFDRALTPQSQADDEVVTNDEENAPKSTEAVYLCNEVFLIESDSDDTETKKNDTNAELTVQLGQQTKIDGNEVKSSGGNDENNANNKENTTEENPSTSNNQTKLIANPLDPNAPILISANFDECSNVPASSSSSTSTPTNTKITNELNYINYLYNRCSYDEKSLTDGSQYWTLHHLKKLVKNSIIPIEINKVTDQNISIKYTTTIMKSKPSIPLIPWNYTKAIDLSGGSSSKTSKTKQTTNQQLAKNHKASIKVPIAPSAKAKVFNGPKSVQFTSKLVPAPWSSETTQKKANSKLQSIQAKPQLHYIIGANQQQTQQIQTNVATQEHALIQQTTQNIPNQNGAGNSILKGALTANPQPILYTYMPTNSLQTKFVTIPTTTTTGAAGAATPTATEVKQAIDQSFLINGMPYQSMANINKNATIVFQQIDQPNFINITQPATATFAFATSENGNAPLYLKQQTNIVQETSVKQTEITTDNNKMDQEQMNEVSSSSLTQNDGGHHRPMIRIKSLSELTAKPTTTTTESSSLSKDENSSYLNAYANYVSTRKP